MTNCVDQKFLFVVDSLRIGGIERNVLDQVYFLSDIGRPGTIILLGSESMISNANFLEAESDLIKEKQIDIRFAKGNRIQQLRCIWTILREEHPDLIIDYSVIGTLLSQIAQLLTTKKIPVHCVIQQFPSLSAPGQRLKRFIYSQFATKLFINSINYSHDWNRLTNSNFLNKIIFSKKTEIVRNGVYLHRLNGVDTFTKREIGNCPRFIFLGRLKDWKGVNNLEVIDMAMNSACEFLIITPDFRKDSVEKLKQHFGHRITFSFGKSLLDYVPEMRDIHIYPVDYGSSIPFVESVSTNCLEMAILGVPSLVTKGGTKNWPELEKAKLVQEVDWRDLRSIKAGVQRCSKLTVETYTFRAAVQAIDIHNNLKLHCTFTHQKDLGRSLTG